MLIVQVGFNGRGLYNKGMNFTYLAMLGRQPELGLIELETVIGAEHMRPLGRHAVLLDSEVDVDRYGGVVKVAKIIYDGPVLDLPTLPIDLDLLELTSGKTIFAVSADSRAITPRNISAIGIDLKKRLKEYGSARFVAPKAGTETTAAQLKFNNILDKGFELILVGDRKRLVIAKTIGVQDIDWFSRRDYDRPARSAKVGMLPPKLARVMINSVSGEAIVDPFCGTGVVLQEALLTGRSAVGSDLAEDMVIASRQNLVWLATEVQHELPEWSVALMDARKVKFPEAKLSIVTEGYLGPNLSVTPSAGQLKVIKGELLALYRDSLQNWSNQISVGTELAICVPAWKQAKGWSMLGLVDDLAQLGYTVKVFQHVQAPVLYSRADQVVGRQLLLLRKS